MVTELRCSNVARETNARCRRVRRTTLRDQDRKPLRSRRYAASGARFSCCRAAATGRRVSKNIAKLESEPASELALRTRGEPPKRSSEGSSQCATVRFVDGTFA